jgi:hypothetical protein
MLRLLFVQSLLLRLLLRNHRRGLLHDGLRRMLVMLPGGGGGHVVSVCHGGRGRRDHRNIRLLRRWLLLLLLLRQVWHLSLLLRLRLLPADLLSSSSPACTYTTTSGQHIQSGIGLLRGHHLHGAADHRLLHGH